MGNLFDHIPARSPKVLKSDDSVVSSFNEDVNAENVNGASQRYELDSEIMMPPSVIRNTRITTATTTIAEVTGTYGVFRIKIQGGTMGLVTIYDNGAASGTVLYQDTPAAKDVIFVDWTAFTAGLTIVTAAATTILVESIAY